MVANRLPSDGFEPKGGSPSTKAGHLPIRVRAKLVCDEYMMRQSHWWSLLNRFALLIVSVNMAPYIYPPIMIHTGKSVLVFPALAFGLSLFATWLLAAEYERLRIIKVEYDALMNLSRESPTATLAQRIVKMRIGMVVSGVYGLGFTGVSLINGAILAGMMNW